MSQYPVCPYLVADWIMAKDGVYKFIMAKNPLAFAPSLAALEFRVRKSICQNSKREPRNEQVKNVRETSIDCQLCSPRQRLRSESTSRDWKDRF